VEVGWRFSRSTGGPIAGQIIMNIVANRVRLGWGNWLQTIDSIPKYMAENEMPPLIHSTVWDPAFVKLLHAVDGIFDGSASDLSKSQGTGAIALYWGDLNRIERPWFREHILDAINPDTGLRLHPIIGNIGPLSFFK